MKHFEVLRKWCKKIEIEIFDKWLISLDRVTYGNYLYLTHNLFWSISTDRFYFPMGIDLPIPDPRATVRWENRANYFSSVLITKWDYQPSPFRFGWDRFIDLKGSLTDQLSLATYFPFHILASDVKDGIHIVSICKTHIPNLYKSTRNKSPYCFNSV